MPDAEVAHVEHAHLVPARQQLRDEDRPQIAGAAGHQDSHFSLTDAPSPRAARSACLSVSTTWSISVSEIDVKNGRLITRRARSSVRGSGRSAKRRKYACS